MMSSHEEAMKDINVIAEKLTITQSLELSKMISTIRNYINDTEWLEKKLEELKNDLARFLVLLDKAIRQKQTTEEMHERWALEEKFKKVGR